MSVTTIQPYHGSYLMRSLEHATVSDAMHPGILSCEADATLTDVARLMAMYHVHCVAVMGLRHDHPGEKLVWGIISDSDLLRAGIRTGADQPAGALALQPIISVEPTMPLREAGELMLTHSATHAVVVDPGTQRPIGVLSSSGLVAVPRSRPTWHPCGSSSPLAGYYGARTGSRPDAWRDGAGVRSWGHSQI